jgi:two-component system, chemotaxis family, chemotaxis protein CheY
MSLNVLIVDDSQVMRTLVKRVVNLSGFEFGKIFEAGDGEDALKALDENWIDIVLTDLNMPVMDGIEFLKRIKSSEDFKNIPVIIVSTEGRDEKIQEIMDLGAAGFISKPFRPEDIRDKISSALGVTADGNLSQEPENSDF